MRVLERAAQLGGERFDLARPFAERAGQPATIASMSTMAGRSPFDV